MDPLSITLSTSDKSGNDQANRFLHADSAWENGESPLDAWRNDKQQANNMLEYANIIESESVCVNVRKFLIEAVWERSKFERSHLNSLEIIWNSLIFLLAERRWQAVSDLADYSPAYGQ